MKTRMTVNGKAVELDVEPRMTLVDALREELGLVGTHIGCEHGVCGACTVIADGEAVRGCLILAVQADGMEITTVEGLAPARGELGIIQDSFCETHAMQCGYCTPGFLLAATVLLRNETRPSRERIEEAISGNLCRCTGYAQIVEAIELAAERLAGRNDPNPEAPR